MRCKVNCGTACSWGLAAGGVRNAKDAQRRVQVAVIAKVERTGIDGRRVDATRRWAVTEVSGPSRRGKVHGYGNALVAAIPRVCGLDSTSTGPLECELLGCGGFLWCVLLHENSRDHNLINPQLVTVEG